jgi:hypothetical protein
MGSIFVFNYLRVGELSNVLGTFVLKLTILVVTSISFKNFDWLCASVDFTLISKWSSLTNFGLHLNGGIPLYQWTSTSLNLWFNNNYNSWGDYTVFASLQGDHFQESIMFFYMFGVKFSSSLASFVKGFTMKAIEGLRNV